MEHYTISNPNVDLYLALVDTVAMAVREGIFKNKGIIQDNYSDSAHWLIRSIEIKDHEHLVEVYKDILFEIQERIARREGQKFILNTDDKIIIIGGPRETLEIFLFNATITFIYISPHSSKFKNKV